ncbi:unnamed protein product, partial [Ixodes hexagonus]
MLWIFVIHPYQLTALLPLLIFPFLGICKLTDLAKLYYNDNVVTLLCCSTFSLCLDRSHLLRRVSLQLLRLGLIGQPLALLMLFGFSTAAVAALARRTLAVTLMSAMTRALVLEMKIAVEAKYAKATLSRGIGEELSLEDEEEMKQELDNLSLVGRSLALNKATSEQVKNYCLNAHSRELLMLELTAYLREPCLAHPEFWLLCNGPCTLVLLLFNVIYLYVLHVRKLHSYSEDMRENRRELTRIITTHYTEEEEPLEAIMILFLVLFLLLLFTREPVFFPGWTTFLSLKSSVTDATPMVLTIVVLAFLPLRALNIINNDGVFRWKSIVPHVPWGLGLMLGSGNAIAYAAQTSGITEIALDMFDNSKEPTERKLQLTVSVALASQLAPGHFDDRLFRSIMDRTSSDTDHALYYLLPAATASTFTYLLPSSNAANLMVYHYSNIKLTDMV